VNFSCLPILSDVSFLEIKNSKRAPISIKGRSFSSLSFRISGQTRIAGDGIHFTSGPDSITFIPQGYSYATENTEGGRMLVMHFVTENDCGGLPMSRTVPHPKAVYNLFENAIRRYQSKGCDLVLMSMAYQLLSEATVVFSPSGESPAPWLKTCKRYIDENITDSSLRIRDLAERSGVSEVYFRREFSRFYGASPLEYIKRKRIETAKILLQTGMYSVTDVAFRSGFESSSYFSSEFRRLTGLSPREYGNDFLS